MFELREGPEEADVGQQAAGWSWMNPSCALDEKRHVACPLLYVTPNKNHKAQNSFVG